MKVALLLLLAVGCVVPPPPAPPRQTHLKLQLSNTTLANGLRVVLVQDPRATEVQVTMRYDVGAADDPDDQLGVAHLVEHLMFQQVLGSKSLFATLEDVTSSFNAFTDFDSTTYISRADKPQLERLLSIEAVRMGFRCTTITDAVFERERDVVVTELGLRAETAELVHSLDSGLYPEGHPYRRLLNGSPATVAGITRAQACAFADAHYSPKNAVLVISGDLQPGEVDAAIAKFIVKIANRPVAPRAPVAPVKSTGATVEVTAALDKEVVYVAWPTATDPVIRARLGAIAPIVTRTLDLVLAGQVKLVQFPGERAGITAIRITPAEDETSADVIKTVKLALAALPIALDKVSLSDLGDMSFHQVRQSGLYRMFAGLDDTSTTLASRDVRIAAHMAAGHDPRLAVSDELAAVGKMSREDVVTASALFGGEHATFVIVHPDTNTERKTTELALSPTHDLGARRDPPDPAEAHRPSTHPVRTLPAAIQQRLLPNGLRVVLAPISSVPTVEIRLVFGAGSGDDPLDQHGTAELAARGLRWQPRYSDDLLRFAAVGGTNTVDVGLDHTSFIARGLDMHVDILLAGLRRWVRDGEYTDIPWVADSLRRGAKESDRLRTLGEAWRNALFGDHAYRFAGLAHKIDLSIGTRAVEDFRYLRHTPDNATLIVAGGFDPAVADRWVDYLFDDWTGRRANRASERAKPTAASLASDEPTSQVFLSISLPSTAPRIHKLIVAEMLRIVAGNLRTQLGATYGLDGGLAEDRLASSYVLSGWLTAERLQDALKLLDQQIKELATGGELAQRTFASARAHVLAQVAASGASTYADQIQHDVALGREPLFDLVHATDIQRTTIEQLSFTDLDLARAAILMRGPKAIVTDAFTTLGRTPTFIEPRRLGPLPPRPEHHLQSYTFVDFDDSPSKVRVTASG